MGLDLFAFGILVIMAKFNWEKANKRDKISKFPPAPKSPSSKTKTRQPSKSTSSHRGKKVSKDTVIITQGKKSPTVFFPKQPIHLVYRDLNDNIPLFPVYASTMNQDDRAKETKRWAQAVANILLGKSTKPSPEQLQ